MQGRNSLLFIKQTAKQSKKHMSILVNATESPTLGRNNNNQKSSFIGSSI